MRTNKEETIKRAIGRSKLDRDTNIELVETMWEQFCNLGIYEKNVIDTTNLSINDTVLTVKEKLEIKPVCYINNFDILNHRKSRRVVNGRIASHGGIDFRRGGNQSPIAWERLRSQAVVETGLDLRPISTETYIKLREVLIVAVYGLKPLQFLVFCDTILILRKRTASNKRAKH